MCCFRYFNKISGDLDSALNKNAAVPKSKPVEVEDAKNLLMATQSCFRYTGLDYVYQVRELSYSECPNTEPIR